MNSELESSLLGHWIHSHEEDSGNLMVFRPNTHQLPPSRGRYEYRLEKGGKLLLIQPDPTDKRKSTEGSWSLDKNGILILHPEKISCQK